MIVIKNEQEIKKMKIAGQFVAHVLRLIEAAVKPGITTKKLNAIAEEETKKKGAKPVFKDYPNPKGGRPFPGLICASVNEEVVHGIPSNRKLIEGDIISVDFGVLLEGFVGDSAITVPVGNVDPLVKKLLKTTEESLMKGIEQAKVGNKLGMVSSTIQEHAEKNGFSVVKDFVGHGIGRNMHEDPPVPNYGNPNRGPVLKEGMTIAIEPMVNIGTHQVYTKLDEWTVVTKDGKYSAHFEHSIAITNNGPEILTLR
ncbi:Methionine aminopeptidase [Candidatus Syntrophocurvum alkaliphilum]|uniref:Methionine aminopeptidase n=1 Tax=Candidatus Syntrophocurvum alkaliphilum TaxID=2293317 RepID=A0A6I6DM17_9FIRM|nr:type I methionyl aminopeptidase [Candidatus Syntrophocurvum alkaliphilum]QGU00800.1 Methionine aminopeptidase [Candidatus Syntrophocurvum alkaliphilum]